MMERLNKLSSKLSVSQSKVKLQGKELIYLRKKVKRLEQSRSQWKSKYFLEKSQHRQLKKTHLLPNSSTTACASQIAKASRHHYSLQVVLLCVWIRQQGNCSLQTCVAVLRIFSVVFGLHLSVPSRTSVSNWEKKLGHYRLSSPTKTTFTEQQWVVILDESISMGGSKLLLLLGIDLSTYSWGQAPCLKDIRILDMAVRSSWKGADIAQRLQALQQQGYQLAYGVSDGGTNLVKALKDSGIRRVADATHAFGNLLKKCYQDCPDFQAWSKQCGVFKRQVMLSKHSFMMPPAQRTQGRFLNLAPLAKWGYWMLNLLQEKHSSLTKEQRQKAEWLLDYQTLIIEIYQQVETMNQLLKLLKHQGLNRQTSRQCKTILAQAVVTDTFRDGVQQYLTTFYKEEEQENTLLCCSDIIESVFGKYKNKIGGQGITESCLTIGNMNQNFQVNEIKKALENTKIKDLKEWKRKNRQHHTQDLTHKKEA